MALRQELLFSLAVTCLGLLRVFAGDRLLVPSSTVVLTLAIIQSFSLLKGLAVVEPSKKDEDSGGAGAWYVLQVCSICAPAPILTAAVLALASGGLRSFACKIAAAEWPRELNEPACGCEGQCADDCPASVRFWCKSEEEEDEWGEGREVAEQADEGPVLCKGECVDDFESLFGLKEEEKASSGVIWNTFLRKKEEEWLAEAEARDLGSLLEEE